MRKPIAPFILLLITFSLSGKRNITIWLCGDSTMSIKDKRIHPETGWGMPLVHCWDSPVTIENFSRNGGAHCPTGFA
ncbi:MAG TPA: hypothetical protein VFP97_04165 [Chitinophagaceae bacterium]|nr:hypothetical protein [Chitinophagaceae bacterium]